VAPAVARWLDAAPADWEAMLVLDPNATAAQSALFAPALSAVTPGLTVQFLVIERERALLGGGPVIEERRGGFHWLHASMFTLPGTPIARPGEHETVDRAFADALASRAHAQGAVGGAWVLYRPVGPAPVPQALDAVPGETRWVETTLLRLEEGLEPVRRRMDKKTRNELRHAARGRTTFAEEPDAIDEAFSLHQAQARTWGHRPPPLTLLRRLLVTGNDAPLARLFTVRDTRGLLAAAYVLDHVSECFVWWTGAHPHARHENAVSWLFWSIAEWAAARGRARFNLGASPGLPGVAAFKRSLGGESFRYPVRALDDSNARGLARMVAALQRRMRRNRPWGEPE
jgi:CelD/BcsL family acetyltransferase involved in cellulose biosynthesis